MVCYTRSKKRTVRYTWSRKRLARYVTLPVENLWRVTPRV